MTDDTRTVTRDSLADCECVPGHRCDCNDLRSLLHRILTSAEYGKMEAEGLAADGLGLRWDEAQDRYIGPDSLALPATPEEPRGEPDRLREALNLIWRIVDDDLPLPLPRIRDIARAALGHSKDEEER